MAPGALVLRAAVVARPQEEVPVGCFGFGDDFIDRCGEDTRLFGFVEDAEFWGEAGVDGVVGDESAGHRVDGADECGADLFGSSNVAVIEQALLGLLDEVGGGADGEGSGDDFAGAKWGLPGLGRL